MSPSDTSSANYDYLICGAGAAGLSLAYHLNAAGLTDKRILLMDRAPKTTNDRTWCFWEIGDGPFEAIVHRRWERVEFHCADFSRALDLAPYRYKMLRGIDFYRFMCDWLSAQPNITQVFGEVSDVCSTPSGAVAHIDGREVRGDFAFNSIVFAPHTKDATHRHLLQHFKGWLVQTRTASFDPRAPTLMDFRVRQDGGCRFCYLLPLDARTALVEYTIFSAQTLPDAAYNAGLRAYLADVLRIGDHDVLDEEFGVIPMTDAPFPRALGERVINIGTAGGRTKPSTGYTFQRIQRQSARIARALKTGRFANLAAATEPSAARFSVYDGALLDVLAERRVEGQRVFADLFRRNRPAQVLKFLDEDTSPIEDVRVLSSLNIPAFTAATLRVVGRRIGARRDARKASDNSQHGNRLSLPR